MLKEKMHVAVPTAFGLHEVLEMPKTINHIKLLYDKGVKSVLVGGTTGEQHSLSLEEKLDILEAIEKESELTKDMEIIMGVSSIRQKDAEKLATKINGSSISAIMLGYPPYIIPSQEEALSYSERIIKLAGKPAILYNNPKRTGFDLSAESIITLSGNELVIGIKDPGDRDKMEILTKEIKGDFLFYAGGEIGLEDKISWGYNRLSSIAGNLYPEEVKSWFEKLILNDSVPEEDAIVLEEIRNEIFQGNAIFNIKKTLADNYDEAWLCRSPIGNRGIIQ